MLDFVNSFLNKNILITSSIRSEWWTLNEIHGFDLFGQFTFWMNNKSRSASETSTFLFLLLLTSIQHCRYKYFNNRFILYIHILAWPIKKNWNGRLTHIFVLSLQWDVRLAWIWVITNADTIGCRAKKRTGKCNIYIFIVFFTICTRKKRNFPSHLFLHDHLIIICMWYAYNVLYWIDLLLEMYYWMDFGVVKWRWWNGLFDFEYEFFFGFPRNSVESYFQTLWDMLSKSIFVCASVLMVVVAQVNWKYCWVNG